MSKIDLNYAYRQAKLPEEVAEKDCVFSKFEGDFTGRYRFENGFYGLSDIFTVLQETVCLVGHLLKRSFATKLKTSPHVLYLIGPAKSF